MGLAEIAARLDATPEQVADSLSSLEELKVVDSMQSFERVRTAAELRHNHFSYDVTALGERVEQFFDDLAGMVDAVGKPGRQPPGPHPHPVRRAGRRGRAPRAGPAQAAERVHRAAGAVRGPARRRVASSCASWRRRWRRRRRSTRPTFADYKRKVADYLSGFWRELGQHADAIGAQVAQLRADPEGEALMLEALASLSVAPHPRLSEQEVRARQLALLRRRYDASSRAGSGAGDSPLRSLDAHLHAAIDWILRGVRRLRERRVQRVNRSSEYRALAELVRRRAGRARLPRDPRRRVRPATGRGTSRSRSSTPTSSRPASRGGTRRSRPSRAICAGPAAARRPPGASRRSPTARRRSCWRSRRSCGGARSSTTCWTGCPPTRRGSPPCPSSTSSPSTCCSTRSGRRSPAARSATPTTGRSSSRSSTWARSARSRRCASATAACSRAPTCSSRWAG